MAERSSRRKIVAALVTAALTCAACALVLWVSDPLLLIPPALKQRDLRAAVAIRDDVLPWHKWITKSFTLPQLNRCYAKVCYFTQSWGGDKREEFQSCLSSALEEHEQVDIFLLAHSNNYIDWAEALDPELRSRIRLVYNAGCHDASQGDRWLRLGAKSYIGHPGWSESSSFYFYFLRRWVRGYTAREAMSVANRLTQEYLLRAERHSGGRYPGSKFWPETKAILFGESDTTIGR